MPRPRKNAGLGFAIPYLHNGQRHDYQPDFVIRLETAAERYLILETKGYDPLADIKQAAAQRWCAAVNGAAGFGTWIYQIIRRPEDVRDVIGGSD
jgi:type III restriction enzyme